MTFQDLHQLLRLELIRRIQSGSLTRTELARKAGFRQGHISNFLNKKRSLSLAGLDRVLSAQQLSVDQIIPVEIGASSAPAALERGEEIPIVSASAAMDEVRLRPQSVIETIHLSTSRLRDNRSRPTARYAHWDRFVAIRADAQQAGAMDPVLTPGAVVVLDRHYNSLAPYRALQKTLFAVRCGAALALRYVELDDGRLVLRPRSPDFPVQLLSLGSHETPAEYIVGRVCMVISDL